MKVAVSSAKNYDFRREALENIAATTIDNITKFESGETLENQIG
jgi:hypothetical protein